MGVGAYHIADARSGSSSVTGRWMRSRRRTSRRGLLVGGLDVWIEGGCRVDILLR